jgi:hypothetical protein
MAHCDSLRWSQNGTLGGLSIYLLDLMEHCLNLVYPIGVLSESPNEMFSGIE